MTQSLATLTSEKSRLEQSFQEDKKKVRAEIKDKTKTIESILVELKEVKEKSRVETEEAKSKLIIERHNRYVLMQTKYFLSVSDIFSQFFWTWCSNVNSFQFFKRARLKLRELNCRSEKVQQQK